MPRITHIVSFRYKPTATAEQREQTFAGFVALKQKCQLPGGKGCYIVDLKAGRKNVSPEGFGKGFDQTFILTFASREDINFYLDDDEHHRAFSAHLKDILDDVWVYDFEDEA